MPGQVVFHQIRAFGLIDMRAMHFKPVLLKMFLIPVMFYLWCGMSLQQYI